MKKTYERPVVLANQTLAEGVFLASGMAGGGGGCYTASAYLHQDKELGRGNFCVGVNGIHNASDGHHCKQQILTLTFNQPVGYVESNGTLIGGDGTTTLQIQYGYHNNANENIGLGDVYVTSNDGLAVIGASLDDSGHQLKDHSVCDSM